MTTSKNQGTAGTQYKLFEYGVAWDALLPHMAVLLMFPWVFHSWFFTWFAVAFAIIMIPVTGCLGITLGYHRLFTHQAFQAKQWVRNVLTICGALAWQYSAIVWCGEHHGHHAKSDKDDDRHTPHRGISARWPWGTRWLPRFGWFLHSHVVWTWERRSPDQNRYIMSATKYLQEDKFLMWVHKHYGLVNLLGVLSFFLLGFGVGFVYGGLSEGFRTACSTLIWQAARLFYVYNLTFWINSGTHTFGYRLFRSRDHSRQEPISGLLAFGEGWHNTHHAFQWTACNWIKWWEIDITWLIIKMMRRLGWVWDVKVPTPEQIESKKIAA